MHSKATILYYDSGFYLSHKEVLYFSCDIGILWEVAMINFEEELKNFQPSLEVEEAEEAIYNHDLTDVTDIISEMLREMKRV